MRDKFFVLKDLFNNNKSILIKLGLVVIFFIPTFYINYLFLFNPSILKQKISKFQNNKPKTLQRIKGSILGDSLDIYVIKIKHNDRIYLDFLAKKEDDTFHLIDTLDLKGKHDGFFEYWDDTLSLALLDDDGDGFLEIIAPTFDKFFRPQLNIIFYDRKKKKFQVKSSLKLNPQVR